MTWLEKRVISVLGILMTLLAVVLLVVLGLRYQAARARQEEEEVQAAIAETEAEETVLNTSPFSALTYTNDTATLSFSINAEGAWVWSDDVDFPLDTTVLATILDELTSWDPISKVTDPAVIGASGINRPTAVLTATMAEEDGVIRLTFGGQTEDGNRYVAVNDNLEVLYVIEDVLCPLLCMQNPSPPTVVWSWGQNHPSGFLFEILGRSPPGCVTLGKSLPLSGSSCTTQAVDQICKGHTSSDTQ